MFPNNYSFNPGMVLDPVTMTHMISNGGAITVNPLGIPCKTIFMSYFFIRVGIFFNSWSYSLARPEQKIWQKMFIKDIP